MRAATPALRAAAARPTRQSVRRCVCRRMAAAAASAAAPPPEEAKTIYLIRHGVTEMNVYLSINNWARCVRHGRAKHTRRIPAALVGALRARLARLARIGTTRIEAAAVAARARLAFGCARALSADMSCFRRVRRRSASFKDPLLYDTKLTREGEKQARRAPRPAPLSAALTPCFRPCRRRRRWPTASRRSPRRRSCWCLRRCAGRCAPRSWPSQPRRRRPRCRGW